MAIEQMRQCGYRKVGGLYLCGEGMAMNCDRLPYRIENCPVCNSGLKFTRGLAWIDWYKYAGGHMKACSCIPSCPICCPYEHYGYHQPYGLLWVGAQYYTPASFVQEAIRLGVSKRIPAVPKGLKIGETVVLLGHKKAIDNERPGIFYVFRPQTVELLIWKSEATFEKLAELEKRNITPIIIPDGDVDHDPQTSLKPKDEEKSKLFYDRLRTAIRR